MLNKLIDIKRIDRKKVQSVLKTEGVKITSSLLASLFRYVILIGICYVAIYPVLKSISMSLMPAEEYLGGDAEWIPNHPTLTNYKKVIEYFNYWKYAGATAVFTIVSTAIQMVITSLVGYGLARYSFKGNMIVFFCVIATIILPIQTTQVPLYVYFVKFDFFGIGSLYELITGNELSVNLINTNWSYYVPALFGMGLNSGLYIFLFRQFFKGMPKDLEDAGRVDGCNPLMVYLRIMVPNVKPVFVTVGLLSSIYYWNDDLIASIFMNNADVPAMMIAVSRIGNAAIVGKGIETAAFIVQQNATMLMAVAPLMIIFLVCQKFFVECMDRSGIKG